MGKRQGAGGGVGRQGAGSRVRGFAVVLAARVLHAWTHWSRGPDVRGQGTVVRGIEVQDCKRGRVQGLRVFLHMGSHWKGTFPPLGSAARPS